jgi:hypothetical protein
MKDMQSMYTWSLRACVSATLVIPLAACNGTGEIIERAADPEVVELQDTNVSVDSMTIAGDLTVAGTTTTGVLAITGGADVAEPFRLVDQSSIKPGAVVIIDEQNPGLLRISEVPYDTRVAGIITGAGGIQPGITLAHRPPNDGEYFIAMSGVVYVNADATDGDILPGDLLTTSNTPGYAMKAVDRRLASGAVIGKALSTLEQGQGLVLVLVNLL